MGLAVLLTVVHILHLHCTCSLQPLVLVGMAPPSYEESPQVITLPSLLSLFLFLNLSSPSCLPLSLCVLIFYVKYCVLRWVSHRVVGCYVVRDDVTVRWASARVSTLVICDCDGAWAWAIHGWLTASGCYDPQPMLWATNKKINPQILLTNLIS